MYYVSITKRAIAGALPRGGVVAEIGVAEGDMSQCFIDLCPPSKLHLIDPWERQAVDDGGIDPNNVANDVQEARYRAVLDRFAPRIAAGQVSVHRAYSQSIAAGFPDAYFDWVYIDGSHLYEHVLADLRLYAPKLKPDGFILGDDHVSGGVYDRMQFGVVPAVREFVRESGFGFLFLTHEGVFVLVRDSASAVAHGLTVSVLTASDGVIAEVRDPGARELRYVSARLPSGKGLFYLSV